MDDPIRIVLFKGKWPIASASPACLKLLTWLRMAEIAYEESEPVGGRPRSKTGRVPYLVRADGGLLDDSSVILDALSAERNVVLDARHTPMERAMMVLIQRTVENHLYFDGLLHCWRDHWPETRAAYFGGAIPKAILPVVAGVIRNKVWAQADGPGMGRRPKQQVLAEVLDDNDCFFGRPELTDAIVYGALENTRTAPLPGPVQDAILSNPRWVAYLNRIRARYWS